MAVVTYQYIANSIRQSLKQNKATSNVGLMQVIFWMHVIGNRIRRRRISSTDNGRYLHIFPTVQVSVDNTNSSPNQVAGRKYSLLPESVYDMKNDLGIRDIFYVLPGETEMKRINWIKTIDIPHLLLSAHTKPSPARPYWYRVHDKVFYLGFENAPVPFVEMHLFTSLDMNVGTVDPTSEIDLSGEEIEELEKEVIRMGLFMLSIPEDRLNDGAEKIAINPQKPPQPVIEQ